MKYLPLLIIGLAMLSGCVSTRTVMDSYTGHNKSELYRNWGPPSQVTSDGSGGEILIYATTQNLAQTPGTVYNNGYGGVNYTAPKTNTYTKTRMFYVNSNGIIYHWRAQGL